MKTIGKPRPPNARALRLGAFIGAALLLGLVAVAQLTGMTGAALAASIVGLLYFTAAVAWLAPSVDSHRTLCG